MKFAITLCSLIMLLAVSISEAQSSEKKEVLNKVNQFFAALENQDSTSFTNLFIKGAFNHYVRERPDTVETGTQSPFGFQFKQNRILKERLTGKGISVKIHKRIAVVWAPYNFWVNDEVSHSGVDVFTFFKTEKGWQISSISFSVEPGLFQK